MKYIKLFEQFVNEMYDSQDLRDLIRKDPKTIAHFARLGIFDKPEVPNELVAAHMMGEFDNIHLSDYEIFKLVHGVAALDKEIAEQFIIWMNGEGEPGTIAPAHIDYETREDKEGWTPQTSHKYPEAIPQEDYNKDRSATLYALHGSKTSFVVFERPRLVYTNEEGRVYMTLDNAKRMAAGSNEKWQYFKNTMPEFYAEWNAQWN